MGKFNDHITDEYRSFIENQKMFFVATAPANNEGHINLSPKGLDTFRVVSQNRVVYLDFIGSGNETSAHLLENGRVTFMFCAFDGKPNILRLYGRGYTVLPGDEQWEVLSSLFKNYPNTRQIIVADIHRTQTSCGFGVPLYEYSGERSIMFEWAEKKGPEGLEQYKKDKNFRSIDGLPTALEKQFA
jgi:predicted pyridoxine 5'-phosphate oxidase superfamily flavin-nucleotide-binding protein